MQQHRGLQNIQIKLVMEQVFLKARIVETTGLKLIMDLVVSKQMYWLLTLMTPKYSILELMMMEYTKAKMEEQTGKN